MKLLVLWLAFCAPLYAEMIWENQNEYIAVKKIVIEPYPNTDVCADVVIHLAYNLRNKKRINLMTEHIFKLEGNQRTMKKGSEIGLVLSGTNEDHEVILVTQNPRKYSLTVSVCVDPKENYYSNEAKGVWFSNRAPAVGWRYVHPESSLAKHMLEVPQKYEAKGHRTALHRLKNDIPIKHPIFVDLLSNQ